MNVDKLTISNSTENVVKSIQSAHPSMIYRELQQNAIEATSHMPDDGTVRITWEMVNVEDPQGTGLSFDKLSVKSVGMGMSKTELEDHINKIGNSGGGKVVSINDNFGQGAKVTILAKYKLGAIYKACKNGVVHQCWLTNNDGLPGLYKYEALGNESVIDITSLYSEDETEEDWVQVVLMGDCMEHNTAKCPDVHNQPHSKYWLSQKLNSRFVNMPPTRIKTINSSNKVDSRVVRGQSQRTPTKSSTVKLDGFHITYTLHDDKSVSADAARGHDGHNAVVWRGEMYSHSQNHPSTLRSWGVGHGYKKVSVYVVLNDDDYRTDEQRVNLYEKNTAGTRHTVTPVAMNDYRDEILSNRPKWLIDYLEANRPAVRDNSKDTEKAIDDILNYYNLRRKKVEKSKNGIRESVGVSDTEKECPEGLPGTDNPGSGKKRPKTIQEMVLGGQGSERVRRVGNGGFNIELSVMSPEDADEQEMGKMMCYFDEVNSTVFMDMRYEPIENMVAVLSGEFPQATIEDIKSHIEVAVYSRAVGHVVNSLEMYRGGMIDRDAKNRGFDKTQMTMAVGNEKQIFDAVNAACSCRYRKASKNGN